MYPHTRAHIIQRACARALVRVPVRGRCRRRRSYAVVVVAVVLVVTVAQSFAYLSHEHAFEPREGTRSPQDAPG